HLPPLVLLLVVRTELAGLEWPPPRLVLAVPGDGRRERVAEAVARRPAELVDLLRVDRVAPVVARPILHGLDQGLGLPQEMEDLARQHDVLHLLSAAECVDLPLSALPKP